MWVRALRRQVAQQTRLLREQTESLRKSEEKFRHMALHDALTGLATRRLLDDRIGMALTSARRVESGIAVLMVDLDGFKEINDKHGHDAGDEVLREVSSRLLRQVRKIDTVARLGGDEFVVLLTDLGDLTMAERLASKIVAAVACPISVAARELIVTASVGICTAMDGATDASTLLKNADSALYEAKAGGRDGFRVFGRELRALHWMEKESASR